MSLRALILTLPYVLIPVMVAHHALAASASPAVTPSDPVVLVEPIDPRILPVPQLDVHAEEVQRLHREAMEEIEAHRADKEEALQEALRALETAHAERRAQLRASYLAELAAWRERCGHAKAVWMDPFVEDECEADRVAILERARDELRALREELRQAGARLIGQHHRDVEAYARARLAELQRAIEETTAPDPFRADAAPLFPVTMPPPAPPAGPKVPWGPGPVAAAST